MNNRVYRRYWYGKTTAVSLIPRLYDVTEGSVQVDGIDVRDYDTKELREKMGYVPQKALLFSETIDSDIAFGCEGADKYRIEETAKIAQSYDFVMKKEDGFGSSVSQGGSNFSDGQRRRLAIEHRSNKDRPHRFARYAARQTVRDFRYGALEQITIQWHNT